MPRVLQPAGKHGSAIIAIDGKLRMIDPAYRCHGYSNGCVCPECLARDKRRRERRLAVVGEPCTGFEMTCGCVQHTLERVAAIERAEQRTDPELETGQPWVPRPSRRAA